MALDKTDFFKADRAGSRVRTRSYRLLIALYGVGFLVTSAYGAETEAIERCRQTSSDADRIACLEATILALTGAETAAEAAADTAVETAVDQASPSVAPASVDTETVESSVAEPVWTGAPNVEATTGATVIAPGAAATAEVDDVAPAAEPDVSTAEVDQVAPEAVPDVSTIGAEQVEARTRTREEALAALDEARGLRVEKFERVGYRQLQVHLENGQVWRQIRGDVQEIRVSVERNPTVDITESTLGGYRLRLNEVRRTIRVQRIR